MKGLSPIILASGSKIREQMLSRAGIFCDVRPADIDESAIKQIYLQDQANRDHGKIALILANRKAVHISKLYPDNLVIGADQILDLDGEIFDKPVDRRQARSQLIKLRGRPHELISAVSVALNGDEVWHHVDRARLFVRDLTEEFIDGYLDRIGYAAYTSPGSYQVDDIGVQLFDHMDGNHYTILGMPLLPLLEFLRLQKMVPS